MKTNLPKSSTLYIGLDVHKEKTSIAIMESHRDAEPRVYSEMITSQHHDVYDALKIVALEN